MKLDAKLQAELDKFTPEQQAMARDYARLRVEGGMVKRALANSQRQYAHLFTFMLAILRQMPGHEIRFSDVDFEAYETFRDSWQLVSEHDPSTREQILKLVEKGVKA